MTLKELKETQDMLKEELINEYYGDFVTDNLIQKSVVAQAIDEELKFIPPTEWGQGVYHICRKLKQKLGLDNPQGNSGVENRNLASQKDKTADDAHKCAKCGHSAKVHDRGGYGYGSCFHYDVYDEPDKTGDRLIRCSCEKFEEGKGK